MKKQNIIIYVLVSMLFVITACQKEIDSNIQDLTPTSDCYLKDGRLVFKDMDTFKEHLKWVYSNQSYPDVIKLKYQAIGLTSLTTVYDNGMDLVDNVDAFQQYLAKHPMAFQKVNFDASIIYELPTASIIAYIANESGIYQIGERVIRSTFDYNLELSAENLSKIDMLFLPFSQLNDSDIKIINNNKDNGLKSGGDYGDYGEYSYKTAYIQSDIRIVARLKTFYAGGPTAFEARTTAQKKGFLGIWSQKTINELSLSWNQGQMKYSSWNYPVTVYSQTHFKTNESDITRTVIDAWYPLDLSQSSCLASHYGQHNTTASITNNEIFR